MIAYATIIDILDNNKLKVKLNSDNVASNIPYYYLNTYSPTKDDKVLVESNLHIVIGKVVI